MTTRGQHELLRLLKQFDEEELNCNGNCYSCYYCMESTEYTLDNCPLLVAYDMIYHKIYDNFRWNKRK